VEQVYDGDGWLLYRVDQPPLPETFAVDFGTQDPRTRMALGEGWAGPEEIQGVTANWAISQDAQLFLPAVEGVGYHLTLTALPFDYPGAEEQRLALWANGRRLGWAGMSPGWDTVRWEVPARYLHQGLNDLRFEFERLDAPADVLPGDGAIGGTGVQAPVAIEVNSSAPAELAYITVGEGEGAEDGSVHRPGYNVAVIDPRTGELLDRQGFDTTPGGNEAEADALAGLIEGLPAGQIVVVALQGDGAVHLTDRAVAALRAIGGQADLRGTTGWSHAIVGVKGAAPGTALEAAGPDDGWLRVAPDRRTLAIAVDTVLWEQTE
jgi:hypothetical protein